MLPRKNQGMTGLAWTAGVALGAMLSSASALALTPLADTDLAGVSGQEGLRLELTSPAQDTIAGVAVTPDVGTANEANITAQNVALSGVDALGNVGGGYSLVSRIDAGATAGGLPGVNWNLSASNVRLAIGDIRLNRDTSNLSASTPDPFSFGTLALDGAAEINFTNINGLLSGNGGQAALEGSITDGNVFYRQLWHEHPYLVFSNFQALWSMQNASIGSFDDAAGDPFGISGGLIHSADRIDLQLEADWQYKFPVGLGETSFTITGNELPLLRFGWSGAFKDADLVWRGRGSWSGENWNAPTGGLTFSSRWNYITNAEATALSEPEAEFRWVFGESGGGVQIELSDWTPLGSNTYAHNWPLIALDVINAGQGPSGLCFGGANAGPISPSAGCANGQVLNLTAGDIAAFREQTYGPGGVAGGGTRVTNAPSLAALVRDGNLLAVSNQLKLVEGGAITRTFDWGLLYTLANVDGNIYLYPGGNPSDDTVFGGGGNSLDYGFIMDLLLMTQTLDSGGVDEQGLNWNKGTHLMLADTAFEGTGVGIGFLHSAILIGANDSRFWIKPQWNAADFYEGGIDILSPQARVAFSGYFGGATLPSAGEEVLGAYLDVNFEGMLNVRLSPSDPNATVAVDDGDNFLGYSIAGRLGSLSDPAFDLGSGGSLASGSGSYIAVAEPNRTDVEVRFDNITGDIAFVDGIMDLRGEGEEGPGSRPALVVKHNILFGQTAAARMNDAVVGHALPGGAAGQPFIINDVSFSGDSLGKIAIPSGQWSARTTFKPQLP